MEVPLTQDLADHVGETRAARLWVDSERRAIDDLLRRLLQAGFMPSPWETSYLSSTHFQLEMRARRVNDIIRGYGLKVSTA